MFYPSRVLIPISEATEFFKVLQANPALLEMLRAGSQDYKDGLQSLLRQGSQESVGSTTLPAGSRMQSLSLEGQDPSGPAPMQVEEALQPDSFPETQVDGPDQKTEFSKHMPTEALQTTKMEPAPVSLSPVLPQTPKPIQQQKSQQVQPPEQEMKTKPSEHMPTEAILTTKMEPAPSLNPLPETPKSKPVPEPASQQALDQEMTTETPSQYQ